MDEDLIKKLSEVLADKDIDLNQILESFQATSSSEESNEKISSNSQIDTEKLVKIQKLLTLLSTKSSSDDANLLRALKPYLRQSRRSKVDTYIKLLNMIDVLENFQEMGGNINDFL